MLVSQFVNKFMDVKFTAQRTIEASSRHYSANLSANRVLGITGSAGTDGKAVARCENRTLIGSGKSRMQSIVDPTETVDIQTPVEATAEDTAAAADGEFSGLKVMVIDDSKTIRRTAETLLKRRVAKSLPRLMASRRWLRLPMGNLTSFSSIS